MVVAVELMFPELLFPELDIVVIAVWGSEVYKGEGLILEAGFQGGEVFEFIKARAAAGAPDVDVEDFAAELGLGGEGFQGFDGGGAG